MCKINPHYQIEEPDKSDDVLSDAGVIDGVDLVWYLTAVAFWLGWWRLSKPLRHPDSHLTWLPEP